MGGGGGGRKFKGRLSFFILRPTERALFCSPPKFISVEFTLFWRELCFVANYAFFVLFSWPKFSSVLFFYAFPSLLGAPDTFFVLGAFRGVPVQIL